MSPPCASCPGPWRSGQPPWGAPGQPCIGTRLGPSALPLDARRRGSRSAIPWPGTLRSRKNGPRLAVQPRVLHSSAILRRQVWQATAHACWSIMVVEARGRRKHVCQRQRAKVPALQGQARQAWEAMREMGGRRRGVDPRSLPQGVQGRGARSGDMQHTRGGCMQAKTTQNASRHPGKNTTPQDQLPFIGLYTGVLVHTHR